jgi:hypothetical protein
MHIKFENGDQILPNEKDTTSTQHCKLFPPQHNIKHQRFGTEAQTPESSRPALSHAQRSNEQSAPIRNGAPPIKHQTTRTARDVNWSGHPATSPRGRTCRGLYRHAHAAHSEHHQSINGMPALAPTSACSHQTEGTRQRASSKHPVCKHRTSQSNLRGDIQTIPLKQTSSRLAKSTNRTGGNQSSAVCCESSSPARGRAGSGGDWGGSRARVPPEARIRRGCRLQVGAVASRNGESPNRPGEGEEREGRVNWKRGREGEDGWRLASGTFKCGGARRGDTWREAASQRLPALWVRAFPIGLVRCGLCEDAEGGEG